MQPEEVELPVRPAPVPELVPASSRSRWKALLVVLVVSAVLATGGDLLFSGAEGREVGSLVAPHRISAAR